jgi:oleate hydratase
MFAFQQWHSAKEFHRYLHRFIQELPRINTLEGVDRTPYNQYDSIILPIITYLKKEGVEFKYNTKVVNVSYTDKTNTTVEDLHIIENGMTGVVHIHSTDIVIITLGSMTTGSVLGTNTTPPAPLPISKPDTAPDSLDGSWALWHRLSLENPKFGNPLKFCTRIQESTWESFTVTLKSPEFLKHMTEWTKNEPGTGALMTLKDSAWLMSIVIPHQPHFINQPKDVQVFWGYGLFPDKVGDYVKKPMYECSGEEIFSELLQHLQVPLEPTLKDAITIPCVMPYITPVGRATGRRLSQKGARI